MDNFTRILAGDTTKRPELIQKQASYLFVALQGIALTAKAIDQAQIDNYIELTFQRI